ncbi:MAG TPA: hypothetical protein ENJ28_01430 [Gammaproteobacteria bacterium]|nr:hypothetical protein [Gammaproteobacteria bacterium]
MNYVLLLLIVALLDYVMGIALSNHLRDKEEAIFKRYNEPSFFFYGPKEYRFILDLILFNNVKDYVHEKTKAIFIGYRVISYILIASIIFFMFQ